jgi:hypothetical protein
MIVFSQFGTGLEEATDIFLKRSPNLPVLICGTVPNGQVALFKGNDKGSKYCIVPYHK